MTQRAGIALVALLFFACGGKAQTPFHREWAFGLTAGANFSSVGFVPKVEQGMLPGYQGGICLRWITEAHLGLLAELNFTQQGWQEDFSEIEELADASAYRYSRTLNYLELPFLTHIYFGDRLRFFFNAGPKIAYLISQSSSSATPNSSLPSNGETLNGLLPQNGETAQHTNPLDSKIDWGLCGGPGLELRTSLGSFLLECRFYHALGNIYGNSKSDPFPKSTPQTLSFRLGYLFGLR